MAWEYLRRISYCSLIFIVHITIVDGSSPKLVSVTRKRNSGDVFVVHSQNNSVCDNRICEEYGGLLLNGEARGKNRPAKCSCCCGKVKNPTFYNTKMGQQSCVKDLEVMKDSNGDICDFYTTNAHELEVLDLHTSGKTRMKPDGFCEQFQISGLKFYFNTSWILSLSDTFSIISGGNGNGSELKMGLQTFLTWDGNLEPFYKGLLIKVMIRCTYDTKTADRCLMLKAKGTHIYQESQSTLPPTYGLASTTVKKTVQPRTAVPQESSESTPPPTGRSSKPSSRQLWIIVSLGLAGVVLITIIVIGGFLVLKCRENCRKRARTVSRHHLTVENSQSGSEVCPALHDYEYVHYPCLVDGGRTPTAAPIGNIKYERGHDNKLIIWSPGHDRAATPNIQAANATAPRLPYQRLLTRTSSSSPDCRTGVTPASSPAMEEVFPYQKLVRSVPSLGCSDKEESAVDASTEKECDVAQEKAYQSLSLQRNPLSSPKECDAGYMTMEGVARPESSSEYDYADPVELNKLFRLSRSKSQQATMEISIGDLGDTASNHDQQQQENCAGVQTSVCASDARGNYENVEDIDLGDNFCTAIRIHKGLNADGLSSTTSYEDSSAKCSVRSSGELVDPEEYVEMGKRRSLLIMENSDSSNCNGFAKIEEEGPEYFVLEGLETDEDEVADDP